MKEYAGIDGEISMPREKMTATKDCKKFMRKHSTEKASRSVILADNFMERYSSNPEKRNEALVECSSESKGIFIARWNDVKCGLVSGNVRGESRVKRNRYEEKEDSVIVFFNNGGHFVCDKEDIELVKSRTWYARLFSYIDLSYILSHSNFNLTPSREIGFYRD